MLEENIQKARDLAKMMAVGRSWNNQDTSNEELLLKWLDETLKQMEPENA